MSSVLKILILCLIILTTFLGIKSRKLTDLSNKITKIEIPKDLKKEEPKFIATLFIPNEKKDTLISEDIDLKETIFNKTDIFEKVVKHLILNLEKKGILKKENYEYKIYLKDKDIYLDLDSEILLNAKTPEEEVLIIYSFVNTLLSLGEYEKVILLIDGKYKEKVNFVNISNFYKLNTEF